MEENNKQNSCGCNSNSSNGSSCCDTSGKKSGITGKIIFFAVLGVAVFLIVYKLFIASPEIQASNAKEGGSCCPGTEQVDCAKDKHTCAGEGEAAEESTKPCCAKEVTHE